VLAAAQRARSGITSVVTIEGEPGIGSSWLVRQAALELGDFEIVDRVAAASSRPSLLVIDDAHELLADEAEALYREVSTARGRPLLVIVAGRSPSPLIEALKPASARTDRGAVIELRGLSVSQTIEMAAEHGIAALDATRADLLTQLTDGNPLHLEAAFRVLGQRLHVSVPSELPVPANFARELSDQLTTIDRPGNTLLELLSVVDAPIARTSLFEIGERLGEPVSADEPVSRGIVGASDELGQRELFIHSARVRSGIRRSMNPSRARQLHGAIAQSMVGPQRLEHRLAATEASDDELGAELEAEANACAGHGRYSDAARFFSKASGVSSERANRERRLLRAAAFAFYSDDAELASSLSPNVSRCSPSLLRDLTPAASAICSVTFSKL